MGPTWGRQDPDGPHVGPMNFAIWDVTHTRMRKCGMLRTTEKMQCILINVNFTELDTKRQKMPLTFPFSTQLYDMVYHIMS